jgi:hypothetical protein
MNTLERIFITIPTIRHSGSELASATTAPGTGGRTGGMDTIMIRFIITAHTPGDRTREYTSRAGGIRTTVAHMATVADGTTHHERLAILA